MENESVLDIPRKEGLNASLWRKNEEKSQYSLTDQAREKIEFIIRWMTRNDIHPLNNYGVTLVGSMCSNSYSEDSDIDLHFNSPEITGEKEAEEFNKVFRDDFENIFKEIFPQDKYEIDGHPIEVYFQVNPSQDVMSVGCYDVLKDEWKSGPEIKDPDFDPYSEYYEEDMKLVNGVIQDIRNVILEAFESAIVIRNSEDDKFKSFEFRHFKDKLFKAASIFTQAREFRKVKSSPQTDSEAQSYRSSRDWKIADSAFKLLDKFGYLGILRTMTQTVEKLNNGDLTEQQAVQQIIFSIQDNIGNNSNLDESEKKLFEDLQEESLRDVAKYAMMIGALSSPMASNGQQSLEDVDVPAKQEMRILDKSYGGMEFSKVVNAIAWTLWTEARGEYAKYGKKSLEAIASVIWNRSNENPENIIRVISQPKQFSWWNGYQGGWNDKTYVSQSPSENDLKNPKNEEIWALCNEMAVQLLEGKFQSTIGNFNSYLNKKTASKDAVNTWGKQCNLKIGNHWFGYQKAWDGKYRFNKNGVKAVGNVAKIGTRTHRISKGETLSKIAKKYGTTTQRIMQDNKFLKDANQIRIGQEIKV